MTEPARLLAEVEQLAFPRFPGTEGERRAADHVATRLEECGLPVTREGFRASSSAVWRLRLLVHGAMAAGMAAIAQSSEQPQVVAALGIGLVLLVLGAGRWRHGLEGAFDIGPQVSSRNIVGRRAGSGSIGRPTAIVMAHVDSKSAALPTFVPVVVILVALALTVAATGFALAGILGANPPVVPAAALWAAAAAVLAIPFIPVGNESPGAMDNASGVAVLLELARTLPADPGLQGVDLVFLATGAEEIGLCGAMRWIQAHAAELDRNRTVVINLDSVGVGEGLLTIDVRGRVGGRPMPEVVAAAAARSEGRVRRLRILPGVGVDSMPFGARGFATVSILGGVLGEASRRIHGPRDTIDLLREEGLAHAARLAREIARESLQDSAGRQRAG